MTHAERPPDPSRLHTLDDLAQAFTRLRRREARKGQVQLSVRDLSARTNKAPSTLDAYLRGTRLPPADVYEDLLRALGVRVADLRPWLDAWERIADGRPARQPPSRVTAQSGGKPALLHLSQTFLYRLTGEQYRADTFVGVITGDIRRVRVADVWVNSENTDMRMSRFEEYSISAIIRFEGAKHDDAGQVVEDSIAEELARKVSGRVPVAPGSVVTTGPGDLAGRNRVRHVIHVAAVRGEPGEGYRQVPDIGRCVSNVLVEAERLAAVDSVRSVLIPLLGTGVAGGRLEPTVRTMVESIVDHFTYHHEGDLRVVYLLASTEPEREVCRAVLGAGPFAASSPSH
ncbi:helix-turn-helix domain-containing protein [Phytohabitans sp. ZYX-F-186]|uniref:Helix-turn-helix domain-containing protein n=1 Tax=Phytohabitans maris TaxID=3071409 RepID=A0ABU0ZGS1_9ACTN|nr:helix-turn-helix domain-containing protein [Phytohabitans sp. ZYX-F-186]MDQ7905661.1 helix-turn-helix domain-containing protein [Phytohabitans sp. ZYX-F-186]